MNKQPMDKAVSKKVKEMAKVMPQKTKYAGKGTRARLNTAAGKMLFSKRSS